MLIALLSYLFEEAWTVRSHVAAISSGELFPGENATIKVDEKERLTPI